MQLFSKAWWAGVMVGVLIVAVVIAPRLATAISLVFLLALAVDRFANRALVVAGTAAKGTSPTRLALPALAALGAFGIWSMTTALWSPMPEHSLLKPAFLLLMGVFVWLTLERIGSLPKAYVHFIGEGALTGVTVGLVLVTIEIVTNQFISRSLMTAFPALHENIPKHVSVADDGTVVGITEANLNRRTAFLTWMFWPALVLAVVDPSRIRRWVAFLVLAAGAVAILVPGLHQTSKMALIISAAVFAASWLLKPHYIRTALAAAWVASALAVVPLAIWSFQAELHKGDLLFHSARHRVVIWGATAGEIMQAPLAGVGADATREAMKDANFGERIKADLSEYATGYATHAHNVYLQVWYEVGLIGALLFAAIGALALRAISPLSRWEHPFALALFAATAVMLAFSYSLWQTWFLGSLTMSICLMAIALKKRRDRLDTSA